MKDFSQWPRDTNLAIRSLCSALVGIVGLVSGLLRLQLAPIGLSVVAFAIAYLCWPDGSHDDRSAG